MANYKIKTSGKLALGLIVFATVFALKIFWWDKRPHDVQDSQTFGQVSIPDAPEASLSGTAAIKLPFPSTSPANNGGTKINWYIMAWQSQNGIVYANGGKTTTKGSLFDKSGLDVSLIRQDDCAQSCAELVKFCKDYKDNPSTPGVFITFMGSGIPAYITGIANAVKDLGPEYQPIAFLTTGKSYGEDQVIGDKKYKDDKQNLKGAVLCGYRMDGDNDLALKLCGDNGIKVNSDETTYDPNALNLMYPKDFLDAVVKYNSGYKETRHIVKNGKTTGRDTTIGVDLVATWTPGDVNAHNGRGGVTIISTKEYASIMPNITITCKKWLNDHRTAVEEITKDAAIAGDQIRSFDDAKRYACKLNADVYSEQDGEYWYKYYNGVKVDENTHLGGSMVFNLADMANMLGVFIEGQTDHNDIYKAIYNTFGTLQSKYYPKDLPSYLEYTKAFDKSVLMSVISNNPDLLQGKVNITDYTNTKMTNKIGNKSYHIEFVTGSANITETSKSVLDEIYQDAVTADGTKLLIGGHTDNTGSSDANMDLSRRRAQSVLDYLRSKGLETARLQSEGYGDTKPVADNTSAAGRSQNRRVEITLLGQ
jgi:outer membrane protein OmpA-like peptidoglycan-associated protein